MAGSSHRQRGMPSIANPWRIKFGGESHDGRSRNVRRHASWARAAWGCRHWASAFPNEGGGGLGRSMLGAASGLEVLVVRASPGAAPAEAAFGEGSQGGGPLPNRCRMAGVGAVVGAGRKHPSGRVIRVFERIDVERSTGRMGGDHRRARSAPTTYRQLKVEDPALHGYRHRNLPADPGQLAIGACRRVGRGVQHRERRHLGGVVSNDHFLASGFSSFRYRFIVAARKSP